MCFIRLIHSNNFMKFYCFQCTVKCKGYDLKKFCFLHNAEKKRKNKWKIEDPTKPRPQWNQGRFLNQYPTTAKVKQVVDLRCWILLPHELQVDISTMLEEAVQYVKFLQLQIKVTTWVEIIQILVQCKRFFFFFYIIR